MVPGPVGTTKPCVAQPASNSEAPRLAARLRDALPRTRLLDLLLDGVTLDRSAVAVEGAPPGRDRAGAIGGREQQVADVILDHRVARQLIAGPQQVGPGAIVGAALEIGPAERVEIRAVVRIEIDRFVQ